MMRITYEYSDGDLVKQIYDDAKVIVRKVIPVPLVEEVENILAMKIEWMKGRFFGRTLREALAEDSEYVQYVLVLAREIPKGEIPELDAIRKVVPFPEWAIID
jgi:hypothetical protein